jgi:hypothetical protein
MPPIEGTTHTAGPQDGFCFRDGDYKHSAGKKVLYSISCHQSQYDIDFYYSDMLICTPFVPHVNRSSSEKNVLLTCEQAASWPVIPLNP